MPAELRQYCDKFARGIHISAPEAGPLFAQLVTETDECLLADCLRLWNSKGIEPEEIIALAQVMRSRMTPVNRSSNTVLADLVGTGGSGRKTFNVSTAAAIVAAAAGISVAKHGNRAATSNSGSIDVLESLGIRLPSDATAASDLLQMHSLVFLAAPYFHRLSPSLASARRSLGAPTIFNCLGPLCNPASPEFQIIGARNLETAEKIAFALAHLGTKKSWVINAADACDEISIEGPTEVFEITANKIRRFAVTPDDFGIRQSENPVSPVSTPAESAEIIVNVLANHQNDSAAENLILVNAAAALFVTGHANDLASAFVEAQSSVRSGAALKKLRAISIREDL